ncbi:MAG: hypothetical protein HZA50_02915 [Planctomycetes bacterium]|nr:hypothetical protein [Planctomycetota bacterium]
MAIRKAVLLIAAIAASAMIPASQIASAGDEQPASATTRVSGVKPGFEKGKFQDVAKEMSNLLMLKLDGKSLKLDRDHWDKATGDKTDEEQRQEIVDEYIKRGMAKEQAEKFAESELKHIGSDSVIQVVEKLQTAAGSTSSGSSVGGGENHFNFQGRGLSGVIATRQESFQALFIEESGPMRIIQFSDDGNGLLRLNIMNPSGGIFLCLSQAADGRCTIMAVCGKDVTQLSGDSFRAIYEKNHEYVETNVFPLLRHIGIGLPILPYSPQVRQAVLDLIRKPIADEEKGKIEALLKNLDSDNAAEREAASKTLGENFLRYSGFIIPALKSESAEVRQRVKKIIADHPEQNAIGQFIQSLKLAEDPAYLVELLAGAKEEDKQTLVAALEKLTGEKFGANLSAWQEYIKKKIPVSAPAK